METVGRDEVVIQTITPSSPLTHIPTPTRAPAPCPMTEWSPEQCSKWVLEVLGLPSNDPLGSHVIRQEITGSVLLSLSEKEMRSELGIEEFGRRRLLLLRLDALRAVQGLEARPG